MHTVIKLLILEIRQVIIQKFCFFLLASAKHALTDIIYVHADVEPVPRLMLLHR